jgi:hypothetical protein
VIPHESGEKPLMMAVVSHFFVRKHITKIAARPPVHAASVVLVATRPTPALSISRERRAGVEAVPTEPEDQAHR